MESFPEASMPESVSVISFSILLLSENFSIMRRSVRVWLCGGVWSEGVHLQLALLSPTVHMLLRGGATALLPTETSDDTPSLMSQIHR